MFIFSQFNFLHPKPGVSKGDWSVLREAGGWDQLLPRSKTGQGGGEGAPEKGREEELWSRNSKQELDPEHKAGVCLYLGASWP